MWAVLLLHLISGSTFFTCYYLTKYSITSGKQQIHIDQSVSRLQHDPYTYESHDSNECDVTFPGWGDTWSVEYLSQHISFEYFGSLVSELMKDKFYVRNFTMRGAPYDFRKSPGK